MPADRSKAIVSTSRRPGWDSVKGKWWCGCSLTEVSKRTYLYHKKEQEEADRHAKENAVRRQSAQQDRQGPSRMPLRELPSQSEQASASSSGFDAGAYTLVPSEVDAFDTGIGMSQPSGLIDEHDCEHAHTAGMQLDDTDFDSDEELGDEFGEDVEPEPILDEDRFVLLGAGDEEDDFSTQTPSSSSTDLEASTSNARSFDKTTTDFLTLVTSLATFLQLGRKPAGHLLAFYADRIFSYLPDTQDSPSRDHCDALERVGSGTRHCRQCASELYERNDKPKILFLYQPLTPWLSWLLSQPGIEDTLQEWRDREPSTAFSDIYDGSAWMAAKDKHGRSFTAHSLSLQAALGVDCSSFVTPSAPRDPGQHMQDSVNFDQRFGNKTQRLQFERSTGARPCALYELSYWRSVEQAPIDFMHCVELGLVKRLFHRTLIDGNTISSSQLQALQQCLKTASVPLSEQAPDRRLGDPGGGSATAAQWSTLGRRLLVLILYHTWRIEIDANGTVGFLLPEKKTTETEDNQRQTAQEAQSAPATPAPPTPAPSEPGVQAWSTWNSARAKISLLPPTSIANSSPSYSPIGDRTSPAPCRRGLQKVRG
ncbi:hypothetical protein V8E36_006154 [Tilletia maclaganii]